MSTLNDRKLELADVPLASIIAKLTSRKGWNKPGVRTPPVAQRPGFSWEHGDYSGVPMNVGAYANWSGKNRNTYGYTITPGPALLAWFAKVPLAVEADEMNLEFIDHDDGNTLVICQHGQILSSYWLCLVPTSAVESLVTEAAP